MASSASNPPNLGYRCAPEVVWAVETRGVRIIQRQTGETALLVYPQAAIWDCLVHRYRLERLVEVIAAVAAMDKCSAVLLINTTLQAWSQAGYLVQGEDDD